MKKIEEKEKQTLSDWQMAWHHWPNEPIIRCQYCKGLHPATKICLPKWRYINEKP